MRVAVCVAAMLVASVLRVYAQADSSSSQPIASAPASTESSPTSNGNGPPARDAHGSNWRLRLGTVTLGAAYFRGPALYPYAPDGYYPFYSALSWNPFWGLYYPSYIPDLEYAYGKGHVKLIGAPKDAKVYLDGGYAGTADRLKHIWLDAGAYDLAVEIRGRDTFQQRIYVLSGKTLTITAKQAPSEKEEP